MIRVFLLIDVSSSMTGQPLIEAQTAAREFLSKCDFTTMEVGLVSFSTLVALQASATSNVRRLHAGVHRLEAEGSTNLTDALEMARGQLVSGDRKRYVVILTDGYPDAPESAKTRPAPSASSSMSCAPAPKATSMQSFQLSSNCE